MIRSLFLAATTLALAPFTSPTPPSIPTDESVPLVPLDVARQNERFEEATGVELGEAAEVVAGITWWVDSVAWVRDVRTFDNKPVLAAKVRYEEQVE